MKERVIDIYKNKNGEIVFDEDEVAFIKKKYEEGLSIKKVAKLLNVSDKTITKVMKKNEIHIRSDREQALKYSCNEDFFEIIDTEEKAYWLGFIYADGYIVARGIHGNRKLGISLAVKDIQHLYKFKKDIQSESPIKEYTSVSGYSKNESYVRILLTSKKLTDDIMKLGVYENKTEIIKFPNEEQVPKFLLKHFVRGYLDGDGCICKITQKYGYRISFCGTKEFIIGLKKYFYSDVKIGKRHDNNVNNYDIVIGGNRQVEKILDILYENATVYLKRKHDIYMDLKEQIKEIDEILQQKQQNK